MVIMVIVATDPIVIWVQHIAHVGQGKSGDLERAELVLSKLDLL